LERAVDEIHSELVPILRSDVFEVDPFLERSNRSDLRPVLRYSRALLHPLRVAGHRIVVQVDAEPHRATGCRRQACDLTFWPGSDMFW